MEQPGGSFRPPLCGRLTRSGRGRGLGGEAAVSSSQPPSIRWRRSSVSPWGLAGVPAPRVRFPLCPW